MSARKRLLVRLVWFVVAVVLASALAAFAFVRRNLPDARVPRVPGLASRATASLDARGIPTIRAATWLDAMRAQGYLVARERLFQLELQRRAADGTLAEVMGAAALPLDRIHRTYDFRQVAEQAVTQLPGDERAELEAYAAGVNAFIASHRGELGLELAILGDQPAPWTAADSIKVLLLMWEDLTSSWEDELWGEKLAKLSPAERAFVAPRATDVDVLVVPDAEPRPRPDASLLFSIEHASREPLAIPPDAIGFPPRAGHREASVGSNDWVVSGTKTKSGKPILANDPHLSLAEPGVWFALRIELPGKSIEGVSFPGTPGVTIGRTDRVAWGATNLGTDVQDLYREPKLTERIETIAVKGEPEQTLRVAIGKHGPQVREGYSLQWVALDPKNLHVPGVAIADVRDWASFNAACDRLSGPAQNVVYADADGHIGWRATGLVPIRRDGDDGSAPRDGTDPANDWRGFVPLGEMPRVIDPPSGFLATANQRDVGTSFPHVVATSWASPNRARRITELLRDARDLDRAAIERVQLDVVSPFHRELMAALAARVPELAELASWDGAARASDRRTLVARAWQRAMRRAIRARFLGSADADFDWSNDDSALLAIARADDAALARAGFGDAKALFDSLARDANAWLATQPATWGEANALRAHHLFGHGGGLLAALFDPPSFPQEGSSATVRAATPTFGQSMRFVVDWGDPGATSLVLPLGESGHLGSAHRTDEQPDWRYGDPAGARTRLEQPAIESLVFEAP